MKQSIMIIAAFFCISSALNAQLWKLRRLEITAAAGTTHSFTDIGRYSGNNSFSLRDISKANMGLALNVNARYRLANAFAVRANLTYGYLHASDINGSEVIRSYEMISRIFEPSVIGEFYIVKNKRENAFLYIKDRRSAIHPLFAYFEVYVFAGLGGVLWDVSPNPELALHITDTKGFTAAVPAGLGITKSFSSNFKGGLELGGRYLLKDNLDALVVPGTGNDSYYFLSLCLTWRFKTTKYPSF
jgi:hypothetical protein